MKLLIENETSMTEIDVGDRACVITTTALGRSTKAIHSLHELRTIRDFIMAWEASLKKASENG